MEKIEKYMKQALKNKVKITKAAIIAILITGGITAPKIARADTPNEKAVDIFKDLTKADVDKHSLQELVNKPKFIGWSQFGYNDNPREVFYLKLREICQKLVNMKTYDRSELLSMQNEINQLRHNANSDGNIEIHEGVNQMNMLDREISSFINNVTNQKLDKHTYKNQMDRLAKIVDRNSEKSNITNEHYYQYYITNENENHGLELGDNSQARGKGSIVTSENGMATGKGAVATGGDNTSKEDIERKLKENQDKLNEIESLKKKNIEITNQLSDLQQKEQDVIQAGIRVEQIRKARANAEKEAEKLRNAWQTEVDGSAEFFKNYQAKIDDLNSRLTGVGKLKNNNIQTPEGLEKAVDEFKHNVEDGTNLNLSRDFYKDYITSYYKALGDLRINNAINGCIGSNKVLPNGKRNTIKNIIDANFFNKDLKDIVIQYDSSNDSSSNHSSVSSNSYSSFSSSSNSTVSYNSLGEYSVDKNGIGRVNGLRYGGYQEYKGKSIQTYKDIDADLTNQEDYNLWKSVKDGWKAQIHDANKRSGSEFFGKFDTLTNGKSTILFNMVTDMKFELVDLDYEITYDQWKYEQTHDTRWLDKKRESLDKRQQKLDTNEKILKDKYKKLFGEELDETCYLFSRISDKIKNDWKKENIDDVENKNKITTEKLTNELEKALGVNKNAIKERKEKLDRMKSEYEQAERNAKGLNPNEKDLILSKEYERVKAEIEQMTKTLKENQERLKALKEALTLYDLKNKGKDNIAYGTDTLAVGDNAIAFGKGTKTVGENSISFGVDLLTTGNNNTNVGQLSQVNGEKNQVVGFSNEVKGDQNLVFGNNNRVISNGQVSSIAKVTFIDLNNKDHIMYVPKHTALKEVPNPSVPDKGYLFKEWNLDRKGTGTSVAKDTVVDDDMMVYQIDKKMKPMKFDFDPHATSNTHENESKYNIDVVPEILVEPNKNNRYSLKDILQNKDKIVQQIIDTTNGVNKPLDKSKYEIVSIDPIDSSFEDNEQYGGTYVQPINIKIKLKDSNKIINVEQRVYLRIIDKLLRESSARVRTRRSVDANPSESTPKTMTPVVNENVLQGNRNEVFGNGNIVFGSENKVGTETKGVMNNILFGNKIDATSVNNAIVFGNESKAIEGAVSFGNDTTTRQLKFVAKGTDDTDAVNFSQLKDYVKKHSKGNNIKGEIISEFNNTPDTYLKIDDTYLQYIGGGMDGKHLKDKKLALNIDAVNVALGKDSNITNPINKFVTDQKVHDYLTANYISKDNLDVTKFLKSEDLDVTGDDKYITVTPNTDKTKKTYKVVFNESKLTDTVNNSDFSTNKSIQDMLDKKADLDGTNLKNINLSVWQSTLGTGAINGNSTGLVTGKTVFEYINPISTKVDQLSTRLNDKLSDITINGDTYIKTEKINNSSYNLSLNKDSLETLINSKIINLAKNDTITNINKELDKKANKNASNLKEQDIKDWQTKLGNGEVKEGNTGLVTGGKVYEVKKELNNSISTNTQKITDLNNKYTTLNNQVATNTSDISELKTTINDLKSTKQDITNINNKLSNIDKSITNINSALDGKLDKTDLSIKGDKYIDVKKDNKFNYTLTFNKTDLEKDLDLTNNTSVNNMFTTKLGNINTNIGELKTKVENNTNSINSLTTKVDTNTNDITTLKQDMTKKLNVDADNLTTKGETNLINKLSKGSDISKPNNKLVTDTQVNTFLNDKFKNFSTNIDNRVINTLQQGVNVVNNKADLALAKSDLALTGISNAVAMANLPQVASYGKYKHMLTAAYGNYAGVNALALGLSGTTDSRRITYKISGSVNTKGNLAFGTGIGVMLGEIHDSNVDTPSHVKEQLIKSEKERQLMRKTLINQQNKAKQQENQIKDLYRIIGELQNQLKNNEKTKESIEKH